MGQLYNPVWCQLSHPLNYLIPTGSAMNNKLSQVFCK